jgi:hypothetical protein
MATEAVYSAILGRTGAITSARGSSAKISVAGSRDGPYSRRVRSMSRWAEGASRMAPRIATTATGAQMRTSARRNPSCVLHHARPTTTATPTPMIGVRRPERNVPTLNSRPAGSAHHARRVMNVA